MEMDQKFQEGQKLWDDGNEEEGAEIWANLALLTHLGSIERLARIFLNQREFEKAENYLKFTPEQSNPLIQTLKLEIAEEREAEHLRIEVAANPNTSLEVLENLSKDGSIYVRHNVGENPSASLKILEILSKDQRALVRGVVVRNPNTSLEILHHLSQDISLYIQDEVAEVLMALAENPSTNPKILEELALTEDLRDGKSRSNIRSRVAANPSTPSETLVTLSRDEDSPVRWCVAENPSSSQTILEKFAVGDNYLRKHVAANPSSSQTIVEALSKDKDREVRQAVGRNPNASLAILKALSQDKDLEVLGSITGNSNSSEQVLELIIETLYRNAKEVRIEAAEAANSSQAILEALSKDIDQDVREAVAANPSSSQSILEALSEDEEGGVRCEVALNSNVSEQILEVLENDGDSDVSAAAKWAKQREISEKPDVSDYQNMHSEILQDLSNDGSNTFLNKKMLKEKKEFQYFSDAERFFKKDRAEEAVELLFELSFGGHIESLEKLFEIFLNQSDYDVVEDLLNEFPIKDNPSVLYMRAKLIEESNSTNLDLYIDAANAGSWNAMLTLVEKYSLTDREEAKSWLAKAEKIDLTGIKHYEEMLEIKPLAKSLKIIVVTSDETGQWMDYIVQRFESSEFVFEFESLEMAIDFCISENSGFEVIQVNESWVQLSSEASYRIKVIASDNRVTIAEGIHDYWYGGLDDIKAAVDEVSGRDCDWEMVYYVPIDTDIESFAGYDYRNYSSNSRNSYPSPPLKVEESTKRTGFEIL